ncbi:MAG: alpha-galactosidase [bacterium]
MPVESIQSGPLRLIYDVENGAFDIELEETGEKLVEGARLGVRYYRGSESALSSEASAGEAEDKGGWLRVVHRFESKKVRLHVEIAPSFSGFGIRIAVENAGDTDLSGVDFYPFILERRHRGFLFGSGGDHDFRFYRHGFLTWSHCGTFRSGDVVKPPHLRFIHDSTDNPETLPPPARGHFIGEWFGMVCDLAVGRAAGRCLLAGFVTADRQLSQVDFKSRRGYFHHLRAVSRGEGGVVKPGGRLESEELLLCYGSAGGEAKLHQVYNHLFETYAEITAERMNAAQWDRAPVGWCSWYSYFWKIDEEKILKNLEEAKELRRRLPLEVFQIDDGYQRALGDWLEPNDNFPNGMKWMAGRIHEAGFKAGLWLAPFFAERKSNLFKQHRDWFVHRDAHRLRWAGLWPRPPLGVDSVYALDTTHPEALGWLEELFCTICRDWGYDYVKIDFIYNAALDGVRHDRNATRAEAFRRGLEAVRRGAGSDRFILGCGSPQMAAVGLVNGMRTSGDTAPSWFDLPGRVMGIKAGPGVFPASHVGAHRYFTNKLWVGDPDVLMTRSRRTSLTSVEILTHASMVALLGGTLMISDDLSRLSEESVSLAQRLTPPLPCSAVPLDMFEEPTPSLYLLTPPNDYAGGVILGVFNWSRTSAGRTVPLDLLGFPDGRPCHVFELWSERYFGIVEGELDAGRLGPHSCLLLAVRPATGGPQTTLVPQLVASTFHFTMGGVEVRSHEYVKDTRRLRVKLELPGERSGTLYFHVPEKMKPKHCLVNRAHQTVLNRERGELYSLELEMEDEAEVIVQF